MKKVGYISWEAHKLKMSLLCTLAVGCTLAATCSQAQQQQQTQQQQPQQGQPNAQQVELVKRLGLSRDTKAPPAWAIPPGMHFAPAAPSNFPIENYTSNVTATSFLNSTKGAPSAGLSITTKDSPAVVFQFYQGALRRGGWVAQIPSPEALAKIGKPGQVYMLRGQRDKQMVNIMAVGRAGETGTNITINWYITP
jgi:hypothetical protein